jgi:hypothetical protein
MPACHGLTATVLNTNCSFKTKRYVEPSISPQVDCDFDIHMNKPGKGNHRIHLKKGKMNMLTIVYESADDVSL